MSAAELARQLDVPTNRVTEILNARRVITGDTALRLAHFFGTTAEFWLNLQSLYELRIAQKKAGKSIDRLPTLKHVEEARADLLHNRFLIFDGYKCLGQCGSLDLHSMPLGQAGYMGSHFDFQQPHG